MSRLFTLFTELINFLHRIIWTQRKFVNKLPDVKIVVKQARLGEYILLICSS